MKPSRHFTFTLLLSAGMAIVPAVSTWPSMSANPSTASNISVVAISSAQSSSEDPLIPNFHSLGTVAGHTNIYRCGCPLMSVAQQMKSWPPELDDLQRARERMQRLYDHGIRTVISFQHQDAPKVGDTNTEHWAVALEQSAAKQIGLAYMAFPMANKGAHSFEDMSDTAVQQLLETVSAAILTASQSGGVAFHCKAGKDRAGLVAGYLRIKYQGWTADEAIAEMRQNGHVWNKFAKKGEQYSWHEQHLRALAKMLDAAPPQP